MADGVPMDPGAINAASRRCPWVEAKVNNVETGKTALSDRGFAGALTWT